MKHTALGKLFGKRKKGVALALTVILGAVLLCGCEKQPENADVPDNAEGGKPEIGLSFETFILDRWLRDRDVLMTSIEEYGAEVNVQNANGDVEEQIAQIEYFIEKDVDAIIVVAADKSALSEVMAKAKAAGIKTICYDRIIENADCDLYVSFDNEQVGRLMGQSLSENLESGDKIFMIQGPESDENVELVKKGFTDEVKKKGLDIVYSANCEAWLADRAVPYMKEAMELYPDVKGVMCGNDGLASQVFRVLSEEQLAGKVIITGQDGDLSACQRIANGTQEMTVFKPIEDEAKITAYYAVKLAKGEDITEELTDTFFDGAYDVPYLELEPISVTRENLDEVIIKGGFHAKEDVYRNVLPSESE